MSPHLSKGFTLIEMMVVLAIMGIIAVLTARPLMNELNLMRAKISSEETQMIVDAARVYRVNNGSWPGNATCSDGLATLKSKALIAAISANNRYNSPYSTSCTQYTFSVDQNVTDDWDGYMVNTLAGTEIVNNGTHRIRTTIGIPGSEPALDSKLSRVATGNAELNRMRTELLLGGNNISEVGTISAVNGSFSGNATAQTLNVLSAAAIAGTLNVQGDSQFGGKVSAQSLEVQSATAIGGTLQVAGKSTFGQEAYFNGPAVLKQVVTDGQKGCETGSIARDSVGKTLSCQSGVWKGSGGSLGATWSKTNTPGQGWVPMNCPDGYVMTGMTAPMEDYKIITCRQLQ